jgi:hypothetical protein
VTTNSVAAMNLSTRTPDEAEAALRWLDPARDTALAREVARRLMDKGQSVH